MIYFSEELLDQAINSFEENPESLRIRKFIFCLGTNRWENDSDLLNQVSLKNLIQNFLSSTSNVQELEYFVYGMVKRLNRPDIYQPIADLIVENLTELYAVTDDSEETNITTQDPRFILSRIIENIESNPEKVRIKKLIFAACKKEWENDLIVIERLTLEQLILETKSNYTSAENLSKTLNKISENLNKPGLYLAISNVIVQEMTPLYLMEQNLPKQGKSNRAESVETSILKLAFTEKEENKQVESSNKNVSFGPNPFVAAIKLELIQNANPLRVKILIYSIVEQPWDHTTQDWTILKTYKLYDLLSNLFSSQKSLPQIEDELRSIVNILPFPDENQQCVFTIMEVLNKYASQ